MAISRDHERRLIAGARAGDTACARELIDLHKDRLFAFVWRMIRHHHDAEEICQEAFLKAFASIDTFSVEYRFSTWLFTIGYRVCLNRIRRRQIVAGELDASLIPLPRQDTPPALLESREASELRSTVWRTVDQLSAPQRATILLFYRHDLGCKEIARILELPMATVKSHLHRARLRLREMLESQVNEGDLHQLRNLSGIAG